MPQEFDESKTLAKLRDLYDTAITYYAKDHVRINILDMVDNGQLWQALDAKLPPYQICPDTNFISYVKSNLVASIYTVSKSASILPTSDQDKDLIANINIALEQIWQTQKVAKYQQEAGEWAALCNLGITQVGWDEDPQTKHKNVSFLNIDPIKFMRDPFAKDIESSGYCITYDVFHESVFMNNPKYRDAFIEYKESSRNSEQSFTIPALSYAVPKSGAKHYYTLLSFWVKNDNGGIDEIHTVNLAKILMRKENIKPNMFPFALLYCNNPKAGRPIGTSEPARIFANTVAYNLLDSIALTSEYRNQRPPKFISTESGLNANAFAKHADDPDFTFTVRGDASKAVHYHEYPNISNNVAQQQMRIAENIKLITGVDDRYTGRDTGSIITTGGTEEMLNRVTVIDTPKIANYEAYTARLTELVLRNMIEFGAKRSYYIRDKNKTNTYKTITVDFSKIDSNTIFEYQILISSELPKNKQRIAALATTLLEKQMQYNKNGMKVEWITPEEWAEMQDIPFKERMLERMGIQRNSDYVTKVSTILFGYRDLVEQGFKPEEAVMAMAKRLQDEEQGSLPIEQSQLPTGVPDQTALNDVSYDFGQN